MRKRALIGWFLVACCMVAGRDRPAHAAAEVHRLNLVISGVPTSVEAKDSNDAVENFNRFALESRGLEGMKTIKTAWFFDTELRYFVRPNIALEMGIGQLRQQSKREFLPQLNADINLRLEILSAPLHVGGAYYLQPYNVGDFRAQAYLGGGFISSVYNRVRMQAVAVGLDSLTMAQANFKVEGRGDSPGYYMEAGAHMFFATRFSVLVGLIYRSQVVRDVEGTLTQFGRTFPLGRMADLPITFPLGGMREFDVSGVGAKMAVAIGL